MFKAFSITVSYVLSLNLIAIMLKALFISVALLLPALCYLIFP